VIEINSFSPHFGKGNVHANELIVVNGRLKAREQESK
jgi:hypothetical protein